MINNTQKKYLEQRLDDTFNKKLDAFNEKNPGVELTAQLQYEMIANKKVKLKPADKFDFRRAYHIADFYDFSEITEANKKLNDKLAAYKQKLREEKVKVMDAVILEGTGLAEAIARFEEIE